MLDLHNAKILILTLISKLNLARGYLARKREREGELTSALDHRPKIDKAVLVLPLEGI